MTGIFRDFARDVFGITIDVPETIPLRILGLVPPVPTRDTILSAFRRRVIEVHPDLQLAYDRPALQAAAELVGARPEIRELVWARDVLMELVPEAGSVTGKTHHHDDEFLLVTPKVTVKVCRKCQRELAEHERHAVYGGHSRRAGWCWPCVHADNAERAKDRRRRRRGTRHCAHCAALFTPSRSDGRYCSPRCRQAAFRRRVTAVEGPTMDPPVAVTAFDASSNATSRVRQTARAEK